MTMQKLEEAMIEAIELKMPTVVLTVLVLAHSSSADYERELARGIEQFNSAYDAWNAGQFESTAAYFGEIAKKYPEAHLPHYWKAVADFHCVTGIMFGEKQGPGAKQALSHIESGIASLRKSLAISPDDSESHALLGTLYGLRIFMNPLMAVSLGPRVFDEFATAIAQDSTNPRTYYLIGMSYLFTPAILGGGVAKAIGYLEKASGFYAIESPSPKAPGEPTWGHSTCLAFLGRAYEKQNKLSAADSFYTKALEINVKDKVARDGFKRLENHYE
ncbi:MAG: hypothetical protein GF398_00830 [Chitinivibrionales bacterium]|nr:hypothetical protein [Chitinivibrionales bacterium]